MAVAEPVTDKAVVPPVIELPEPTPSDTPNVVFGLSPRTQHAGGVVRQRQIAQIDFSDTGRMSALPSRTV